MDEKIICKSSNKKNTILLVIGIISLIATAVFFIAFSKEYDNASKLISTYWSGDRANESLYKQGLSDIKPMEYREQNKDFFYYACAKMREAKLKIPLVVGCGIIFFVSTFTWLYIGRVDITVTDKRIYGRAVFGKYVDIPLNSIVMYHIGNPKKIVISTAAGKVVFAGIKNRDEVYHALQTVSMNK